MIVDVWPQNQYVTLLVADSEETGSNSEAVVRFDGFHIFGWNQTVDLASPGDDEYALSFQWDSGFSIYAYAAPYGIGDDNGGLHYIGGNIGEEKFDGESLFTEGTLSVSGNNDGTPITVILDGKLKNGKTLKMKLVSGNYDICW